MIKKLIYVFVIMIILVSILKINVYSYDEICKIEATTSKTNIVPEEEFQIIVSLKEINEGITGIGFSLNYNYDYFDIIKVEENNEWMVSRVETQFTILTKNFEATTKPGNILKITLKAKENIDKAGIEEILINNLEVSKDDASIVKLKDIKQKVEVTGITTQNKIINKENKKENNSLETIVKNPLIYVIIAIVVIILVTIIIVIKRKNKKEI